MPELLAPFREYLVAQGVVRKPAVAGAAPPLWLEPIQGLPAPGEKMPQGSDVEVGDEVVLGAFLTGGFAVPAWQSFWRNPTVDLRIRATRASQARIIEEAVTELIIDKREWQMDALLVIESQMWRAFQPLPPGWQEFSVTKTRPSHDYVVSYRFQVLAQ